jgi:alpha-galactosidase
MMDKLGYDIRVQNLSPGELEFSKEAVKTYKKVSNVIWFGDLYRIESPYESDRAVVMYVNENKSRAILFNYHLNTRRQDIFNRVKLQGLDPAKKYRFEEINLFPGTRSIQPDNDKLLSGDYLMKIGLNLSPGRTNPLTSNIYELTEEGARF